MNALVLAGGSGTRFWPLSRRRRPKQLLALEGDRSLLQMTVDRLGPLVPPNRIWVCTTAALADAVAEQLPHVPPDQILAEPEGRNTAPAIAWAIASMPPEVRDEPVIVLPADHRIGDETAFVETLRRAVHVTSERNQVVALGVTPTRPETGYGYLELGERSVSDGELRRVVRFTEKPGRSEAEAFLASGRYRWNAGVFVFRGATLLDLVDRLAPEIASGLEAIRRAPSRLRELYGTLPSISIDYAIMERLDDLLSLPLDCDWSDLGSWEALADVLSVGGSTLRGDVVSIDASNCLAWSEDGGTIALVGVEGLTVVKTDDAVLVMPTERSQEVRRIVDRLKVGGRDDLL